jgi:hypothetical protein
MTPTKGGNSGVSAATPRPSRCRRLVLLILALAVTGAGLGLRVVPPARAQDVPALYVYLHTDAKVADLERILKTRMTGLRVTVFGRFRDFEEAMVARPPEAVMALPLLLSNQGVPTTLQGLLNNQDAETYSLISVERPLEGDIAGKTIGAVDLLGRDGTQTFVGSLLGTTEVRVKRVTKIEDLLPLLQFSAADGVVVSKRLARTLSDRTRMPLQSRDLPGVRVKLPAVGVRDGRARATVVQQIRGLDGVTNMLLGVDAWRPL